MKHTVFVTGASQGIGAEIACRFAREGHRVAFGCHTHPEAAEALCAPLRAEHFSVMTVQGDVAREADVSRMLSEITDRYGDVDILVSNAGVALPQKLLTDCTEAEISRLLAVDAQGAMLCARAVLPGMVKKKRGSIVNIGSYFGVIGGACEVPYSAAKAALTGMTRALAKEVAPSGIRVNCVAPGFVDTGMNAHFSAADRDLIKSDIPLETFGTPADIADAVLFLALESARFITGQVLCVDGGASL